MQPQLVTHICRFVSHRTPGPPTPTTPGDRRPSQIMPLTMKDLKDILCELPEDFKSEWGMGIGWPSIDMLSPVLPIFMLAHDSEAPFVQRFPQAR